MRSTRTPAGSVTQDVVPADVDVPGAGVGGILRRLRARVVAHAHGDRGDVPGWVLVTLMTAGLVVTLWAVAGPRLAKVFDESLSSVHGPVGS